MTIRAYTDLIVVHCSATKPSMDHVNEDEIRQWHLDRGWSDAGYNIVIPRKPTDDDHGLIEIARPLDVQGAHVAGYNHRSLGICLVGGMAEDGSDEDNFLDEQLSALETALLFCLAYAPKALIRNHRSLDPRKTCPVMDAEAWAAARGYPV
jgi:hypothetical protein